MSTYTNKTDFCFTNSKDWNLNPLSLTVLTSRMGVIIASIIRTARRINSNNLDKGLSPEDKGPGKSREVLLLPIVVIIKTNLPVGASARKKVPEWKKRDVVPLGL